MGKDPAALQLQWFAPQCQIIHFREFPAWWIKSCHALIHCVIASFCVVMMITAGITCSSVMVVFVKSSPFHPPQIKGFAAASKSFCDDQSHSRKEMGGYI